MYFLNLIFRRKFIARISLFEHETLICLDGIIFGIFFVTTSDLYGSYLLFTIFGCKKTCVPFVFQDLCDLTTFSIRFVIVVHISYYVCSLL